MSVRPGDTYAERAQAGTLDQRTDSSQESKPGGGNLDFQGAWNQDALYEKGDIVRYGGAVYVSKDNYKGISPADKSLHWDLLVESPGTAPTSSKPFEHIQNAASSVWIIDHNLDRYTVSVVTYDSAGTEVWGKVSIESSNRVVAQFTTAFGGRAVVF